MSDACVIAVGAISALGEGESAYRGGALGDEARGAIARDAELEAGGLARPFSARVTIVRDADADLDSATCLLSRALGACLRDLDTVRPDWRGQRVAIALGTSSGGMRSAEQYFAARASHDLPRARRFAARATYFAPFDDALAAHGLGHGAACIVRRTQLITACAASTFALGFALRWLRRGACDVVLAGGYDAVSLFVASGFEGLRATTATQPAPFRLGRDGMSLGEGAAVLAIVRGDDLRGASVRARIAGFGASTDAVHMTAPDRTGGGLARAARAALDDAAVDPSRIGLVSAHGTSTPFNDAMEARAIGTVFDGSPPPIVHAFKAQIGHTLGAAGVLESLAVADAIATGIAPATRTVGAVDPDADVPLLARGAACDLDAALKLSAAFGGANAALVFTRSPSPSRARKLCAVGIRAHARIDDVDLEALARATGVTRDRLARLDALCRLGLSAVAALARGVGRGDLAGAGIVAGHFLATIDTNHRFDARRRARGAQLVEARLFPATSPNAIAGECALIFGLTGPSLATGAGAGGALEALAAAAELIASGDVARMVVLAADDAGPCARDLARDAGLAPPRRGAIALLLEPAGPAAPRVVDLDLSTTAPDGAPGHLALAAWIDRD